MEDRYLFKAKELDDGEWVQGALLLHDTDAATIFNQHPADGSLQGFEVDQSTICQCTGLKDKNGKLIWENDIMVAHLDENYPEDETYIRILWNGSGFCTKEKGSEDTLPIDKFDQEHFEVVGNIFGNAELLGRNDE